MANPVLHSTPHGLSLGEVQQPREAPFSRRKFLYKSLLAIGSVIGIIELKKANDNRSELADNQKLVIQNINSLRLESGDQITDANNPAKLLEGLGIKPDNKSEYTFTSELISKTGIVVKFPDESAARNRADNRYLHIKISGVDFIAREGNFSVVNK